MESITKQSKIISRSSTTIKDLKSYIDNNINEFITNDEDFNLNLFKSMLFTKHESLKTLFYNNNNKFIKLLCESRDYLCEYLFKLLKENDNFIYNILDTLMEIKKFYKII